MENDRLSQRTLEDTFNDSVFKLLFNLDEGEKVRHSSISERLSKIQTDYFRQIYDCVYSQFSACYSDFEVEKYNLIRVDSSIVSDTSGRMAEGMDNKSGKLAVKYSTTFDGMLPCGVSLFTEPTYFCEDVEIKECTIPHISVTDSMTPNDIAFRIRQYMQIPKGPIQNLISHLEDMGIIVYEMEFNTDKLMGFTVYTDTCQPIIFINVSMPNDRKRFTLGHELGHIVMHLNIDTNDDDKEIEHQADAFASEFLMPILDCIEDIRYFRIKRLDELKAYWKVSKAAIIKRALTAKVITEDKYKYFMIELSRMGERKTERGFVPLDKPTLLRQMVEMHINELNYTKSELAQILGLSESDCDSYLYMNASPRRLQLRLG